MKNNIELSVKVCSLGTAEKKIRRAQKAAEKLKVALDDLKNVEIGIAIVDTTKKWYQFWL